MTVEQEPVPAAGDDFSNMDLATSQDPRAVARMLRNQPVMHIGEDFTLLTRRPDIESALRTPAVFSSAGEAVNLGNIRPLIPLQIDPPKHVKYRRVLDPLFAPRQMAALEDEVAQQCDAVIETFAGRGHCDLHAEFSVPLPCAVFLKLMGLPLKDLDIFLSMKDGIIRPDGATFEEQEPQRRETALRIYEYFTPLIAERRRSPADDLLTRIVHSEIEGQLLTDEEVLDICFLFIIAGLDTVTDSLDCFFAYLAQEPEHRRRLVADPGLIPSAVEELLRWESPVPTVARVAAQDTEVAGCPIKAGEHVMVLLGSANTDHDAVPGLDTVDLARNPNPHLAFGGGVHRCLGSHLARQELRVALRQFHRRIPDYELPPGTVLEYTPGLRSVHELPLVFPAA
jgi:cytochrome P450